MRKNFLLACALFMSRVGFAADDVTVQTDNTVITRAAEESLRMMADQMRLNSDASLDAYPLDFDFVDEQLDLPASVPPSSISWYDDSTISTGDSSLPPHLYSEIAGPDIHPFTENYYMLLASDKSPEEKGAELVRMCEQVEKKGHEVYLGSSRNIRRVKCWIFHRIKCCRPWARD